MDGDTDRVNIEIGIYRRGTVALDGEIMKKMDVNVILATYC